MAATLQPGLYACVIITLIFATIVLGLRFYARWVTEIPLWYDDYLAIVCFLGDLGYDISTFVFIHHGLGRHTYDLHITEQQARYYEAICQEIQEHTYTFAIAAAQLSLLALYWRIFGRDEKVRKSIWVLIGVVCAWFVVRIFVTIFQCFPPRYFWDKSIRGTCTIDPSKFFVGSVSAHLAVDIALMILPATQIYKLRLPTLHKLAINTMFMFGATVCVASIMMIVCSVQYHEDESDIMWNTTRPAEWSAAEVHLSLIACCLPVLRPVMKSVGSWFIHRFTSNASGKSESCPKGQPPVQQIQPRGVRARGLASLNFHSILESTHNNSQQTLAEADGQTGVPRLSIVIETPSTDVEAPQVEHSVIKDPFDVEEHPPELVKQNMSSANIQACGFVS